MRACGGEGSGIGASGGLGEAVPRPEGPQHGWALWGRHAPVATRFAPRTHPLPRSYLAHGTATDYMYGQLHVPVALTWEVYGDASACECSAPATTGDRGSAGPCHPRRTTENAHPSTRNATPPLAAFEDCFRAFNPVKRETYEAVIESWTAAFFSLALRAREHPALGWLLTARGQPQRLGRKAEPKQADVQGNETLVISMEESSWHASSRQAAGALAFDVDQALPWAGLSLAMATLLFCTLKRRRPRAS